MLAGNSLMRRSIVPFIDLSLQHRALRAELKNAIDEVMRSQQFVLHDKGRQLESEICAKIGTRFAVGVASGSDALYLALTGLGVGHDDEVITTPFTFFATAGSISRTGAKPVFVDVDKNTFNIDPSKIEGAITKKTKAIIPVHLFGLPCDMPVIRKIASKHSLFVIEDAAQSFGAKWNGKETGSMGDAGCLSFFPTKNLGGAGDGGMVVTSSEKLADTVRTLRPHGSRKKYHHEMVGINSRLDEIQAAVLLVKLKYIDRWNGLRQKHAALYDRGLAGLPVTTPACPKGATHIYHLYSVLTPERVRLAAFLKQRQIGSGVYYPLPLHLQPCYKQLGYHAGDLPVSERLSREVLSLPMYPELSSGAITKVIKTVKDFFAGAR